jgi:hypothetical protein
MLYWKTYGDDGTPLGCDEVARRLNIGPRMCQRLWRIVVAEVYWELRGRAQPPDGKRVA